MIFRHINIDWQNHRLIKVLIFCFIISSSLYGQLTGHYKVEYQLKDYRSDFDNFILNFTKQNCQASFVAVQNNIQPYIYDFADHSKGNIDSWFWDFGDGAYSFSQNPTHMYIDTGIFQVCLKIKNFTGNCSDSLCQSIAVNKVETYNIGGQVFIGNQPIDHGLAILYTYENGIVTPGAIKYFDTLGFFDFFSIIPGKYLVRTELSNFSFNYNQYLPTFFGDELSWENATIINVDKNIWNLDIQLLEIVGLAEYSLNDDILTIYPNPFHRAATVKLNTLITKDYTFELMDQQGRVVRSTQSISSNKFEITRDNLDNGLYFFALKYKGNTIHLFKLVII